MHRELKWTHVLVLSLVCLAGTTHAFGISFTAQDLGTLPGYSASIAYGVNATGQVAGAAFVGGSQEAFADLSGSLIDLGTLGGTSSRAFGINDAGSVVGEAFTGGDVSEVAFADYGGGLNNMPGLSTTNGLGGTDSFAYDISDNANKEIVGSAQKPSGNFHAYFATVNNVGDYVFDDLGTLGGNNSDAYSVNAAGGVSGDAQTAGGEYHAIYWSSSNPVNGVGNQLEDLGTLSGASNAQSFGNSINNNGVIVGYSDTASGPDHAFMWNGTMHDLGTLGGVSQAEGINNNGLIVGRSVVGGVDHAFIYTNGVMMDLNNLLTGSSDFVALTEAFAINDAGQIVGDGITTGGQTRAFELTMQPSASTPEPGTMLLFAPGLAALFRRRRK